MTETALKDIVQRAVRDGAFLRQLRTDPAKALAGTELTADERAALAAGDPARLTALGVDQRISKAFSAGIAGDGASRVIHGDPDLPAAGTSIGDETTGATAAIVGDPGTSSEAALESSWPTQHLAMIEQDLDTGTTVDVASDASAGPSHLEMIERDLDTGASVDSASDADATGPSHLQMIERDLDTDTAFESASDPASGPSHLQMVEQDLDTGATPEPNIDSTDVQLSNDEPTITS